MMPVKIECECGQNYAFDVEPVDGRMPAAVSCPSCGADGTLAANDYISRQLAPAATAGPESVRGPVRLARAQAHPTAPVPADDPERGKLVREAKAKMIGGESMEQVTAFLKVKGFNPAEAMELAYGFNKERVSIVRSNGVKKMIVGLLLIVVPLVVYLIFKSIGRFYIKSSIMAYIVGIIGAYMFVSGIIMVIAPKSEKGMVVKE